MSTEKEFKTLKAFYPYYLTEHSNPISRRLHFIGTFLFLAVLVYAIIAQIWWLFPLAIVIAYGFAWVGHFFFEKNKPATFQYPFFSLASDFIMAYHFITGQLNDKLKAAQKQFN